MLIEAFLGWFVVVGADLEGAVDAELGGLGGEVNGFGGCVGTGSGDDLDAAGCVFDGELDDAEVFLASEVGDSPVVPQGTMPLTPPSTWRSMIARKASVSISPLRNGVMSAVWVPWNMVCAVKLG